MNMQESQLPKGWKFEKVGNITKICLGLTYTPTYIDEGVPFLSVKDISQGNINFENTRFISREEFEKSPEGSKPKKGDVLFGRVGTIGCPQILNEDIEICIFVSLGFFRVNKEILFNQYIAYWMKSNLFSDQVDLNVQGSTLKNLNTGWLKEFVIPLPPLPEQQRIVSILDEAFAAIAKAKANAEQNLKNARELFESYLQRVFEKKVHGNKFETLESLCELVVDCEHKTAPIQDTGYPSIRTPNIGKGELILENVNRVSYDTYIKWTNRAVPKAGDLILAREAPAGNIAVIPENLEVCLGQRTVLIRPKTDRLISKYLAYLILSKDVQEILLSHSTGATVQHINMKDIRAFKIYDLSSLVEQRNIVSQLDTLRIETQKLEAVYRKKIADLEELKKSLLQKAFSGEL